MEFFDLEGTNDEEKAQALDILTNETAGVEFFLEYNGRRNAYVNNANNGNENIKPSYVHVNGVLPSPNGGRSQELTNSFTYQQHISNVNHSIPNSSGFVAASQSNWAPATSMAMQPNGAGGPVVCASLPSYMYQQGPYFAGLHNASPSMYQQAPQMAPAMTAMKPMRMPPPNSSALLPSSSTSTFKNTSKGAATNVPNCDIPNSYYMPSHHYPAQSPQIVENGRLNASAISASRDIINEHGAMSPPNAPHAPPPPHMAHPHHQHPYYPTHAFPHPSAAALIPGHYPNFPVYFLPHPEGSFFPHYPYSMNITANHPNVMPTNASQLDLAPLSNQHPSSTMGAHPSASSSANTTLSNLSSASNTSIAAAYHSSQSSQADTPTSFEPVEDSNVSFIGEPNDAYEENGNVLQEQEQQQQQQQEQHVFANKHVPVPLPSIHSSPSTHMPSSSPSSLADIHNSSFPTFESQITEVESQQSPSIHNSSNQNESESLNQLLSNMNIKISSSSSSSPSNTANDANKAVENTETLNNIANLPLPNSRALSCSLAPAATADAAQPQSLTESTAGELSATAQDSSVLFFGNIISSSADSAIATPEITTKKPASAPAPFTWASKLFGAGPPGSEASPSHSKRTSAPAAPSAKSEAINGDIDGKPSVTNGDFPELSAHKPATHNHHASNFRTQRNRHLVDDLGKVTLIPMSEDPIAVKLARRLRDEIHLKHSLPTIVPCGLVNRGNWCYVNATLQALLACPPFYNLMREIGDTSNVFRKETSTPTLDAFARYFCRFLPTDVKRQVKAAGHQATAYLEELLNSDPFEPSFVYDTLKHIGMIQNDSQRGHQEDAEEFLSSVLNGLHDDMIKLSKHLEKVEKGKANGFGAADNGDGLFTEDDLADQNDDNMWHEVGSSKHKALPTRSAKLTTTAITEIFGGSTLDIRTVNNNNNSTGNRQPFFALQLDIKQPNIRNLEDALRWQTRREVIQGYICPKTKQVVEAYNQMFLESVPPILILHLKLFDFDIETGAQGKVLKRIEFGENFEIPRDCFHGTKDSRQSCKKYKLLGVVYHSGQDSSKGHYTTDVYHLGLNQWLRTDDSTIKVISLSQVLSPSGSATPYLLFYRRQDTLLSPPPLNSHPTSAGAASSHVNLGPRQRQSAEGVSAQQQQHHAHAHPHGHHNAGQHGHTHVHNHHNNPSGHRQQQHSTTTATDVAINTSNKFSSISRHN